MISLYLWDDATARRFVPFALTRPAGELRAGAVLGRERWEHAFDTHAVGFVAAPHLDDFEEPGAPRAAASVPAGAVLVNARCLPSLGAVVDAAADVWECGGRVAAVRLTRELSARELAEVPSLDALASAGAAAQVLGRWLDEVWDIVGSLRAMLADDIDALVSYDRPALPAGVHVIGDHTVSVEPGATIEPLAVLDATAGPILIRRNATIASFTRLAGPCYVGEGATVSGGRVATASIGPRCKVSGEVSTTVFHSYANKGHEGFVGHSVIGRWANLGAGTTTSNLKNTYGSVQVVLPEGRRSTGLQFLGSIVGDHVKTGIGTRLTTGTVLGAGANVFGGTMPPRYVPPFSWGDAPPFETFDIERFLTVAERVLARRDQPLGPGLRRQLAAAHALAAGHHA